MALNETDTTNDLPEEKESASWAKATTNPKANKWRTATLIAVTGVMTHMASTNFGWNWSVIAIILAVFFFVVVTFEKYVGDDNEDKIDTK